ncbi:Retrovirus-related Pol polyprotein from transposon gypsy [Dictyocoela muelleri]|nr:Retrovirus-related Pol polyprotein from transposon gypsy [Dictyocoela muelleri]
MHQISKNRIFITRRQRVKYISTFYVFNTDTKRIILGMQFLYENYAIINLKEKFINLDQREYEISVDTDNQVDSNDNMLSDKTNFFSMDHKDNQLKEIIKEISTINPEIGHIRSITHSIELTKKFDLKFKKHPVPLKLRPVIMQHLNELEYLNIIKQKEVQIASPGFPIMKKNKKVRLVIDYRKLNQITKPINVFFPKIADILHTLNGSKYFSTLDLNQGYYQISVNPSDVDKTAFRICGETYVFFRMPFGLSNAPRTTLLL